MSRVMKVLLVVLGVFGVTRARTVATYDQRQDGKVNVQIEVKDVQIVALVDSEMLEDYTVSVGVRIVLLFYFYFFSNLWECNIFNRF